MRGYRRAAIGLASVALVLAVVGSVVYVETDHNSKRGVRQDRSSVVHATGVNDTGKVDVTARIQALVDSLPDGATLDFTPNGKYRIEGTIHVKDKRNIAIDGRSSLFFATTKGNRTRSQWSFEGGSNILVKDVKVKGGNPDAGTGNAAYVRSLEAQHAFNISSTNGIELDHVSATDVYGDFVYVGAQTGRLARDVYIHDSTFARSGRQGISVTGGANVRIIDNSISDVRRSTFDLEPLGIGWGALNVDIEHNIIGAGRLNLIAAHGIGPVSNLTFAHNTIDRSFLVSVVDTRGGRRGPITILDNIATGTWGGPAGSAAMSFTRIDGLTIRGNTVPIQKNRGDYGVKVIGSSNVHITDNTVPNAVAPYLIEPGRNAWA